MPASPTILIVDDEPKALFLLRNLLEPLDYRVCAAESGAVALELASRERPDVILLDVMMPELDGYEVCERMRTDPDLATVPIILLTALDDRDSRLRGLSAGADDFLTKPFDSTELRLRLRTITRLNRFRLLHEESSRFEAALAHSHEGIVLAESDGTILLRNAAFDRLISDGELNRYSIFDYLNEIDVAALRAESPTGRPVVRECILRHGRNLPTIVEIVHGSVPWQRREISQFHLRDVTEKKSLEAQLLRSQRIELLGQLSGSVVHDMNNVLAAIGGSAMLIEMDPQGPNARKHCTNIQIAAQRGAGMLRQLLHFARGSDGPLERHHLDETVYEVSELVRQSFGALYQINFEVSPKLPAVSADGTQVHQIVMNLCVNARDAMPEGGKLDIAVTQRAVSAEIAASHGPDIRAGDYVVISVRDHGTGIPPEVRARLFDPFFTTKAPGKGTGLGLATVMRLVRRHGGFVSLETEVGRGTCFHCHFPVNTAPSEATA